ncbi:hypothetical protein LSPH26S_02726 [Lysinibacillus sphaericus]
MAVNLTPFCCADVVRFGGALRGHTRKPQPSLTRGNARVLRCVRSEQKSPPPLLTTSELF